MLIYHQAAFVSMSFLIPFAIYGTTLFNGQMVSCNDGNFQGSLGACVGEYQSSPFAWNVLAPRAAENSYYDFDNFADSLFILFQIVSQEGWIDVQWSAMSITGPGQQPQAFAAQANGLFFIVFNLLGSVFILTLFVSVFMRNYTEQTGVAFLTAEQRSWLELRKLLRQISPSKRTLHEKTDKWRQWCYRIAVKKHGRWAHCVTTCLVLHLLLLMCEFYPSVSVWGTIRGKTLGILLLLSAAANMAIRCVLPAFHPGLYCECCDPHLRLGLATVPAELMGPLLACGGSRNVHHNHSSFRPYFQSPGPGTQQVVSCGNHAHDHSPQQPTRPAIQDCCC